MYFDELFRSSVSDVAAHSVCCCVQAALQAVKEEEEVPPPLPAEAPPRPPAPAPVSKWTLVDYDEDNPPADLDGCVVLPLAAHSFPCVQQASVT